MSEKKQIVINLTELLKEVVDTIYDYDELDMVFDKMKEKTVEKLNEYLRNQKS